MAKLDYRAPEELQDQLTDARYDPSSPENLEASQQKRTAGQEADLEKLWNTPAIADKDRNTFKVDKNSIEEKAKSKVADAALKNAGPWGKALAKLKGKVPTSILLLIAMVGGLFTAVFLPASMPLISLEQNADDAYSGAAKVQRVRAQSTMRYMIGNDRVVKACAKNPNSQRCQRGTMSETQKKLYEKVGFKLDSELVESGGRKQYIIKAITSPDEKVTIKDGDGYWKRWKADLKFARMIRQADNAESKTKNGGRFLKNVLMPLGYNKRPNPQLSKDKDEQKKTLNKLYGLKEDGKPDEDSIKQKVSSKSKLDTDSEGSKKVDEHINEKKFKGKLGKGPAAVLGMSCLAKDAINTSVVMGKLAVGATYIGIALTAFKQASEIRQGIATEENVTAIADRYTATDKDGRSAMESQGVKAAMGSGEKGIAEYTKYALQFNNPIFQKAEAVNNAMDEAMGKAHITGGFRGACKHINSLMGQAAGAAACAALAAIQGAGSGAIGTLIVPLLGTAFGGLAGAAAGIIECAIIIAASFGAGKLISKLMDDLVIPWAMKVATSGTVNASTVGPPLGDATIIGAGIMLNRNNRFNGMVPATKKTLLSKSIAVNEANQRNTEIEVANARSTPFDVYNRYSFLGSIVSNFNSRVFTIDSRMQSGNFAFLRLFSTFSLTPSALASDSPPSNIGEEDVSTENCHLASQRALGLVCDIMGTVPYTMAEGALTMPVEENLNFMEGKGYVDEEGTPNEKKDYAKFVKYCVPQETDAGITLESISSPDYDWAIGEKCGEQSTELTHFQAYYADGGAREDSEYTEEAGGGAGGQFRMATFNLLGANHGQKPKERLDEALKIIRDNDFDIVGLQEVEELQFDGIVKDGTEYDIYPSPTNSKLKKYSRRGGSRNAIIWKKSEFTLVEAESGTKPFYYFNGDDEQYPYVTLMNSRGQKIIVFNTHDPTSSPNAGNQSEWREKDAKIHLEDMEKANATGTPVFMTGDFNSAFVIRHPEDNGLSRDKLTYCIMTSTGRISNALDVSEGRAGQKCPIKTTKEGGKGSKIDHIYMTSGIEVTHWEKIQKKETSDATDHPVVFADISIPGFGGDEGEVSSADFSYPLGEDTYKKYTSAHLKGHGSTGTAWGWKSTTFTPKTNGQGNGKGAFRAVDLGVVAGAHMGTPIRAMWGGTVVSTDLCGNGGKDGVSIKSKIGDHTIYTAYMHSSGQKVSEGDTVKAGQIIAKVDTIGCNSTGAHLHVAIAVDGMGYVCPQDVFLAGGKNLDFKKLLAKAKSPEGWSLCSRSPSSVSPL